MTQTSKPGPETCDDRTPIFDVKTLLGPDGQAHLRHAEDIYTLRLTRNDKLILTK